MIIVDSIRTPFCKMGTDLAPLSAADLGQHAVTALLARTGIDPDSLSEVIFGCVGQPADAANIARVIALRAGIPPHVPAATVHRNCASGFESLTTAAERHASGHGDLFIVGGTESMSNYPLLYKPSAAKKFAALSRTRSLANRLSLLSKFRPADLTPLITLKLGLTDPVSNLNMGETAEILAREFNISREQQDAFAAISHRKALAARQELNNEIAPVFINGTAITSDNGPRDDSTPDKLATLKPVFDQRTGSVTAGNSSQITDGAVALLVASEQKAHSLGLEPLGRLAGWSYAGCNPKRMGLGPVPATENLLRHTGRSFSEFNLVELNEAFAAQALAVLKSFPATIPDEQLNPRGGAIALGHPVGATGARLVQTALLQLRRNHQKNALVTACVGGGQGAALWLETL